MEECAEIQKAAAKALRFGLDDHTPNSVSTNAEDIATEIIDLVAVIAMLKEENIIPSICDNDSKIAIEQKKEKVKKYMDYAKGRGTLWEDFIVKKFDENLYLADMYDDDYFPNFLVDKVKSYIVDVVQYLESGERSIDAIQAKFDTMTDSINDLQEEFEENDSEIETGARESIGETVRHILKHFNIAIDVEEAIRNRDW